VKPKAPEPKLVLGAKFIQKKEKNGQDAMSEFRAEKREREVESSPDGVPLPLSNQAQLAATETKPTDPATKLIENVHVLII
jgi:hypothetical protein